MKLMWFSNRGETISQTGPVRQVAPVVASVEEQTTQAAQIAEIDGQDRLTDPRTNPVLRPLVDDLRNQQLRLSLFAEHGRTKRRFRVADRRAADAELTLEAILQARQASSAARSVLALHKGRTRFMAAALGASVILSCGSAAGVEKLAEEKHAPALTGYVAEIGMVGLSTMAILYLAHLAHHGWANRGWQRSLLWVLAIVPLLASVAANLMAAGLVGVACSIGAAAFGAFSHLIGDASAQALRAKAEKVSVEDETTLHAVAMGEDLFSAAPAVTTPRQPTVCFGSPDGTVFLRRPLPKPTPSAHPVAIAGPVDTTPGEHSEETAVVPTGDHNTNAHPEHKPEPTPAAVPTDPEPTEVPTPVTTVEPMDTTGGEPTPEPPGKPTKPKAKRRTRDEIRKELEVALNEHYAAGGGEPEVKPLAERINANRRIVRELLDEMNVRPMIRKAVGQ